MKFRRPSPAILFLFFSFLLLGIFKIPSSHAAKEENFKVPIDVLQQALRYVNQYDYLDDRGDTTHVLERLEAGHVDTLYEVAKSMNKYQDERLLSIEIWDALASGGHTLSQVALGFAFAENDKNKAIDYFVAAAHSGPHQGAMFNAGRLLAEPEIGDYVKALTYFQGAWNMGTTRPQYSTNHMVETSRVAYERLSEQLINIINERISEKGGMISMDHILDMFHYSDLNHFPPVKGIEVREYANAMRLFHFGDWEYAIEAFGDFEKKYNDKMSELQKTIVNALKVYCRKEASRGGEL